MPTFLRLICLGNICRSPKADGVFHQKVMDHGLGHAVRVGSAARRKYRCGSPPAVRTQAAAKRRGDGWSALRARQIVGADDAALELILAMAWDNLALLQDDCPAEHQH